MNSSGCFALMCNINICTYTIIIWHNDVIDTIGED